MPPPEIDRSPFTQSRLEEYMELFIAWIIFSGLAAWISDNKGHGAGRVFLLSIVLSPLVGLIVALVLPRKNPNAPTSETHTRCPDCRELVRSDARKCKHCGASLSPTVTDPELTSPAPTQQQIAQQYGIEFDGKHYLYAGYRYDRFSDAHAYARKQCGQD